ncbi:tRNA lysidine(34) synthetase TilS [Puia sp.]|jgi:tRNA(Ile)-lysidine synthase|uniref:tRNA lysidine(34) synthetase TilS n=1 Tax=Puia sp. TaxID=2045100 RepID=UPI002F426AA8
MELLEKFKEYIAKENLFTAGDKLLLAVSGGLDSVVLADLCHRCGFDFLIVHCNFQLRGEESERDERLVSGFAVKYGRKVQAGRFDTADYAAANKISIQVAARELRYRWFEGFVREGQARWIVTAHHLDDNIETMLMHFFKGTGIAGMRGMLPKQGNIVRPLLFARKEELRAFAVEAGLEWVEDSSNESDKYTRNFFRHQLLPLVEQAYPAAASNLADNLDRFREVEAVYRRAIGERLKKLREYRGNEVHVPVEKLRKEQPLATIVYHLIEPFGFSPKQVGEVIALLDSATGKYVRSAMHRIIRNRNWLIIVPLMENEAEHILVEEQRTVVGYAGGELRFERLDAAQLRTLDQGPAVALLDADKIGYPLLLRRCKAGDYFYPLGLRKKKKVARFLTDNKLSLAAKQRVWILEMDQKLIWVIGQRIDDRWKVGPGTKRVLKIAFAESAGDATRRPGGATKSSGGAAR